MKRSLKNLILIFFTGALLIAGLSYFTRLLSAPPVTNPDQLDFRSSNKLPTADEVAEKIISGNTEEAPTAAAIEMADTLTTAENKIWQGFEEILKNKNDNDPRLDSELKSLSPNLRQALYRRYDSIPAEDRNSRGLIVFLITRDLQSSADAAFLKKVYQEAPCLSLENCAATSQENSHLSGTNQTTMNYPQLAGLFQLERQLKERPAILQDPQLRADILEILKNAENFPVSAVQDKARKIRTTYGL